MNTPHTNSFFALSPLGYKDIPSYFRGFLLHNEKNPKFTQRAFAKDISWQLSLCSNLATGKKGLSIKRLIEFSRYFNFNRSEVDYLFYLLTKEQSLDSQNQEYLNHIFLPHSVKVRIT